MTPPGADAEDRWVRRHRLLVVLARVTLPVTGILVSTGTYSGSPAVAALVAGVVGALAVVFRLRGQEPPTVDGARTAYVLRTHRAPADDWRAAAADREAHRRIARRHRSRLLAVALLALAATFACLLATHGSDPAGVGWTGPVVTAAAAVCQAVVGERQVREARRRLADPSR